MEAATHRIHARLERFELEALFLEELGWQWGGAAVISSTHLAAELEKLQQGLGEMALSVVAIAPAATLLHLPWQPRFTPSLRSHLYAALITLVPDPLLVLGHRDRSLWLWGYPSEAGPAIHSRVWVRGQPHQGWGEWLQRLAVENLATSGSLHRALKPDFRAILDSHGQGFRDSLEQLASQIQGLPGPAECHHYALVVLVRLMAMTALQQRGFLEGDEWYLQNKYGQSQQGGRDQFYSHWLRPLWHQGLTLPRWERSQPIQQIFGEVPFLPNGLFQRQALEIQYPALAISDGGFEAALTWLGDMAATVGATHLPQLLAAVLEAVTADAAHPGGSLPAVIGESLSDRLVRSTLITRLARLDHPPYPAIADGVMQLTAGIAAPLLVDLHQLAVLDPACGSGRYLFTLVSQIMELLANLVGIVQQDPQVPLPPWLQTAEARSNPGLALQAYWMTYNLFGIDDSAAAIALAQLHWFLSLLPQVQTGGELTSLPDPFLNLQPGNALVGLLKVDSQRFEQVREKANQPPDEADMALQGNLLQPLLAEDYQTVLRERQIRLEHYRSQTHLLAETGDVPGYVQVEFLRDRIEDINRIAQKKLNQLLLNEFAQQLGIGFRQIDHQGRSRRRPLELADIEALNPFHWGFQFDDQVVHQGGFDLVISRVPWGKVDATTEEFCQCYINLLAAKDIQGEALRHHRTTLLNLDGDLATAWSQYRGRVQTLSDYFRRADAYPQATQPPAGQRQLQLYRERLFLERIMALLQPGGRAALILSTSLWHQANGEPLRQWLQETAAVGPVVEISNHQAAIADPPSRQDLSLVWLQLGESTESLQPLIWTKEEAPSPATLAVRLQRLLHLGKEVL